MRKGDASAAKRRRGRPGRRPRVGTRRFTLLSLLVLAAGRLHAASPPWSPRIANYEIQATYDEPTHRITAHERLTWHNPSHDAVPDLYFHLYLNAFANDRSSFVHEAGGRWVDWIRDHPHGWGYIAIQSLQISGVELQSRL